MTSLLAVIASAGALLVSTASADVVVTRDALPLPAGCSVTETATLVTNFLAAFNRGDLEALDRLFAPGGEGRSDFKWYSFGEGDRGSSWQRQVAIRERGQLIDYFRDRHLRGDTMRLVSLDIGAGWSNDVGISYVLIRQAGDIPAGLGGPLRLVRGKGQIDCATRRIFVWSMAMGFDDTFLPTTCPAPAGWKPGAPALACTRGPNARAVAPDVVIVPAARDGGCRPAVAYRRIRSMLNAFNIGNAAGFRVGLARRATFSPAGRELETPRAIQDFVGHRYFRLGEGWTLTRLSPLRGPGRFAVTIAATRLGVPFGRGVAKILIDCRTGRVMAWSGPALRLH